MRLSCTVFEVLSLTFQTLKRSRDSDHAHFRDGVSYVNWDLLCSTHIPNLKCLWLTATKISKATQNVGDYNSQILCRFSPRDALLARYNLWSCVCPSVRLFVTSQHCTKTTKRRIMQTTQYGSPGTLVFWRQNLGEIPTASPLRGRQIEVG